MRQRNGFTLIETLMAVVIVGALVLIGYPKVSRAMVTTDVRSASTAIANMFARARAAATAGSRQTAVVFSGNQVLVTAKPRLIASAGSTIDTIGGVMDLNAVYGVTVTPDVDSVAFDPRGLGGNFGSTASFAVARSGHSELVTIDGLGRVIQ